VHVCGNGTPAPTLPPTTQAPPAHQNLLALFSYVGRSKIGPGGREPRVERATEHGLEAHVGYQKRGFAGAIATRDSCRSRVVGLLPCTTPAGEENSRGATCVIRFAHRKASRPSVPWRLAASRHSPPPESRTRTRSILRIPHTPQQMQTQNRHAFPQGRVYDNQSTLRPSIPPTPQAQGTSRRHRLVDKPPHPCMLDQINPRPTPHTLDRSQIQPFSASKKERYPPTPARLVRLLLPTYPSAQTLEQQRQQQQKQPQKGKRPAASPTRPRSWILRLASAESLVPPVAVQVQRPPLPIGELLSHQATTTTAAWRCEQRPRQ